MCRLKQLRRVLLQPRNHCDDCETCLEHPGWSVHFPAVEAKNRCVYLIISVVSILLPLCSHTTLLPMASLYHRFGAFYSSSFSRRPWLTLAVANGTLGVIADGLAQTLDRREQPPPPKTTTDTASTAQSWDFARSGRFLTFGVVMAPLLAEWNKFIEYRFPLRPAAGTPASLGKVSMVALAKRVAFDQVLL